MRKFYTLTMGVFFTIFTYSQVVIAETKTSPDGDGILDFEFPTSKGIALPKVTNLNSSSVPGTLYFDTQDSKVKFLGNSTIDLSVKDVPTENRYNLSTDGYNSLNENNTDEGVVIGSDNTNVVGVMVLDSKSKALILPKANSYLDVKDPEPGMIIYDDSKNMFCVYNGYQWAFWGK